MNFKNLDSYITIKHHTGFVSSRLIFKVAVSYLVVLIAKPSIAFDPQHIGKAKFPNIRPRALLVANRTYYLKFLKL